MAKNKTYSSFRFLGALLGCLFSLLILGITSFAYLKGFTVWHASNTQDPNGWDWLILIFAGITVLPVWFIGAILAGIFQAQRLGNAFARNIETDGLEGAQRKTMRTLFTTTLKIALVFLVFPGCASGLVDFDLTILALTVPVAFVTTFLVYLLIGLIILFAEQRAAQGNVTGPAGS